MHPHLYEINTWAWLEGHSRRSGRVVRLGDVPDEEWDRLRDLGFDFVWLMGMWRRSPEGRRIALSDPSLAPGYDKALPGWRPQDVVGSPYAVRAYEPDPRLATWRQVDRVRAKLHRRGLRLILDFVPNHTARDHAWVAARPERYIQGTPEAAARDPTAYFQVAAQGRNLSIAHGKDPYFPPWSDTAQLNYHNPETRRGMIGELRRIAGHCDGVRCDMAMLLLNRIFAATWRERSGDHDTPQREFWDEALASVPDPVMIAEVYWDLEWELQQLGFHFTYDKRLYDRLRAGGPRDVGAHLAADLSFQSRLVRFLENHDEPRGAAVFGPDRLMAAATLVATLPGMRLYHQGQLEGRRLHLPVQLRRAADEAPDRRQEDLYRRLLMITKEELFHAGRWRMLPVQSSGDGTCENLLAYEWRSPLRWGIVAVNLSGVGSRGCVRVSDPTRQDPFFSGTLRLIERLRDRERECAGVELSRQGFQVSLPPYGAEVWTAHA